MLSISTKKNFTLPSANPLHNLDSPSTQSRLTLYTISTHLLHTTVRNNYDSKSYLSISTMYKLIQVRHLRPMDQDASEDEASSQGDTETNMETSTATDGNQPLPAPPMGYSTKETKEKSPFTSPHMQARPFIWLSDRPTAVDKILSPDEVRERAQKMAQYIFDCWETLQLIITYHEEAIQKRWVQKSKAKRKAILLQAWPEMPLSHTPDVEVWNANLHSDTPTEELNNAAFKWPWMNLEELCKTEPLLLMLKFRGRNSPANFTRFDRTRTQFGQRIQLIQLLTTAKEHTMILKDAKTPEEYWQLYAATEEKDVPEVDGNYDVFPVHEGLLILEIQERIYELVVRCAINILHDIPSSVLVGENMSPKPEPPMPSSSLSPEGIELLAVATFERRYKGVEILDLDAMESLVRAKLANAEDHLWLLRADPVYFGSALKRWSCHRAEHLPDYDGFAHPVFDPEANMTFMFWRSVISTMILDAFQDAYHLNDLLLSTIKVRDVMKQTNTELLSLQDPNISVVMELRDLSYCMNRFVNMKLTNTDIGRGIWSLPGFSKWFCRVPPVQNEFHYIEIEHTAISPCSKPVAELSFLLYCLSVPTGGPFTLGTAGVVTEIELMIRRDPAVKSFLSSWMADHVSTIGVYCECFKELECTVPWVLKLPHSEKESAKRFSQQHVVLRNMEKMATRFWNDLTDLKGMISDESDVPMGQRPTKDMVEKTRRLEKQLDDSWEKILDKMKSVNALSPSIKKLFERELHRTPPWTAPIKKGQELDEFEKLMRDLEIGKQKAQDKANAEAAESRGLVKVDQRALKTFNYLLFDRSDTTNPGKLFWKDVLYAMKSAGFTAVKHFGSGWLFRPTKLGNLKDAVWFNEPYDEGGKVTMDYALLYGQHLNTVYGWTRQSFTLAK
ncbi:hypothetical protein GGR54DRAFT_585868 [Hypoxylon sp. NC1633]|nr:hypothetical protein GGR54DRAFT_585868 [Hypoxylon sp. NC1633]